MLTPRSDVRSVVSTFQRLVLAALVAASPLFASAKTIMVVGPHPDDEVMTAGGRVRAAVNAGDEVIMVLVTNGDGNGDVENGLIREDESVAAAALLGVPEQNVVFLGYGDGLLQTLYESTSGTQVYTSSAGQSATYGGRGLGGVDFHRYVTGSPAPYSRNSLLADLKFLLALHSPDELYTVAPIDTHPDHSATAGFVVEALVALQRQGAVLPTRLFQTVVWTPATEPFLWPQLDESGFVPDLPFFEPLNADQTPFSWDRLLRFPVPAEMQSLDPSSSLKFRAIEAYVSQGSAWLTSFARKDEFFWPTELATNRALTATVTVSGDDGVHVGERAIDGRLDDLHSWSANAQTGWIQLAWPRTTKLSLVLLNDLVSSNSNVRGGTLTFSDGSSISVPALPANGQVLPVAFTPRSVRWVRFTVTSAEGTAGLAEFQALGPSPYRNTPPIFLSGPVADLDAIYPWETTAFTVATTDLDGQAVSIAWSADGGTLQGSGSSVVFQPPAVAEETTFTVTARATDARGAVSTNTGIITVYPSFNGLGLSPSTVEGGASVQGSITSAVPAPAGGLTIALASDSASVTVPATVTIPEGQLEVTFTITTSQVAATVHATVSTVGGAQTASLVVLPPLSAENHAGGATVTVSSEAPGQEGVNAVDGLVGGYPNQGQSDQEWSATTLDSAWIQLDWPSSVLVGGVVLHDRINGDDQILAGTLTFSDGSSASVGTLPDDGTGLVVRFPERAITSMRFTITRAVGVFTGLAELEVFSPSIDAVSVSPGTVSGGGALQGTVTLAVPAFVAGEVVQLSSDNAAVSVPASVMVAAGASTASFTISTSAVQAQQTVTITATFSRGPRTTTLTLVPVTVNSLSVSPSWLTGGESATGTIQVAFPVSAPQVVALSTSEAHATVPSTVTIPAGARSTTFTVQTTSAAAFTPITVFADVGGSPVSTDIYVFGALTNLAPTATVEVSSENPADDQLGVKAIDGVIEGYSHGDYRAEWVTVGGGVGAWIRLTWSSPVTIQRARLYDRPNSTEQILSGRLHFSDASTVEVGALPNDALTPFQADFAPRAVSWVEFEVLSVRAGSQNIGLAELELYGPAAP